MKKRRFIAISKVVLSRGASVDSFPWAGPSEITSASSFPLQPCAISTIQRACKGRPGCPVRKAQGWMGNYVFLTLKKLSSAARSWCYVYTGYLQNESTKFKILPFRAAAHYASSVLTLPMPPRALPVHPLSAVLIHCSQDSKRAS